MSYTIIKDPSLEPFYVSKDQYCYTVYENVTPDPSNLENDSKGKDYQKSHGHFSKFSNALESIARMKLDSQNKEYDTIRSYIKDWEYQVKLMEKILKTINL